MPTLALLPILITAGVLALEVGVVTLAISALLYGLLAAAQHIPW